MAGLRFIEPRSTEWHESWAGLGKLLVARGLLRSALTSEWDYCQEHTPSGECWQYMGTTPTEHQFRHRWHPTSQKREYVHVPLELAGKGT